MRDADLGSARGRTRLRLLSDMLCGVWVEKIAAKYEVESRRKQKLSFFGRSQNFHASTISLAAPEVHVQAPPDKVRPVDRHTFCILRPCHKCHCCSTWLLQGLTETFRHVGRFTRQT